MTDLTLKLQHHIKFNQNYPLSFYNSNKDSIDMSYNDYYLVKYIFEYRICYINIVKNMVVTNFNIIFDPNEYFINWCKIFLTKIDYEDQYKMLKIVYNFLNNFEGFDICYNNSFIVQVAALNNIYDLLKLYNIKISDKIMHNEFGLFNEKVKAK